MPPASKQTKSKSEAAAEKKPKILTAEGWKRRFILAADKKGSQKAKKVSEN